MTELKSRGSTLNTQFIHASPETLYHAFTDPQALAVWFAPGDMTAKVHNFDLREGGGYQMSLYYPSSKDTPRGKTAEKEDKYTARFVELSPPNRIVETITFDSSDPSFSGEMTMQASFEAQNDGTLVSILFEDLPPGISPEDNEMGTRLTLEKLARYIEG